MKKLWFKAKRYGWGWYPSSWEGWSVMAAYIVILFALSFSLNETQSLKHTLLSFFIPITILTAILIKICYKTGEKPRWRWG